MDITNIFCQSLDLTSHVARVSGISGEKGKRDSFCLQTYHVWIVTHLCSFAAIFAFIIINCKWIIDSIDIRFHYQPLVGLHEASPNCIQTVCYFILTSHETLLYHWATCKENKTKAQLMFCQPFIVEEFLLGLS